MPVKEIFTELRVPILADITAVKHLSLNGAYRYSDYSLKGIGGVSTYSLGSEWAINNNFSVRAQIAHHSALIISRSIWMVPFRL